MIARTVFFGVFAMALLLCPACGDDTQVFGQGQVDAESDLAIASDVGGDATPTADSSADITEDTTAAAPGGQCQSCESKADCGESFDCIALLNGSFCINKCQSALDCSSKFTCDKADTKDPGLHCLPPNYACAGCLVTGCPTEQICDPISGKCGVGKAPCTPCKKPSDCGPGLKCAALASPDFTTQTLCMPDCSNNAYCPQGSVCQKTDAGNVCGFTGLACCYGSQCQAEPSCANCAGKCILGSCVACLLDTECPGGHCDGTSHKCVNTAGCPDAKPVKLADGTCAQCGKDSDCKPGKKCDTMAHACIADPNTCKACNAPYPDCVQVNGTWSCVECASDATCAAKNAGTCSSITFACSAWGDPEPTTGNCKQDSDCKNFGPTAFDLACDATTSGLCYDKSLKCDNIVAFCNGAKGCTCQPTGAKGPDVVVGKCSCGF